MIDDARPAAPRKKAALQWVVGNDTGTSSLTIGAVMMGVTPPPWPDVPCDPSDFGRCYRLLKVMPRWRLRLQEVAKRHPRWKGFVEAWDELTTLYTRELKRADGMAPLTYERMKKIRGVR